MNNFPEIPGYTIIKQLGKGGMSLVFLAKDEKLERDVAIKIMISSMIDDSSLRKRFLREAKTVASLRHSNIVAVHDVGETKNKNHYFVMEYLSGGSLKDKITKEGFTPEDALFITKEIAKALSYAHKKGFVHRDIKPANIMFREDGQPVLTDFGIAKALDSNTKLTRTGTSVGTPYYMSPEQVKGENITEKSDIYSLGVVLYEMLTGDVPYDAESTMGIALKHLQEPIPVIKKTKNLDKTSPYYPYLQELLNNMMEKDYKKRFSADQVIEFINMVEKRIESIKNGGVPSFNSAQKETQLMTKLVTTKIKTGKKLNISIIAGIAILILTIFVGGFILLKTKGEEPQSNKTKKENKIITSKESKKVSTKKKVKKPDYSSFIFNLKQLFKKGNYSEMAKYGEKLIDDGVKDYNIFLLTGRAYLFLNDTLKAYNFYEEAFKLKSKLEFLAESSGYYGILYLTKSGVSFYPTRKKKEGGIKKITKIVKKDEKEKKEAQFFIPYASLKVNTKKQMFVGKTRITLEQKSKNKKNTKKYTIKLLADSKETHELIKTIIEKIKNNKF